MAMVIYTKPNDLEKGSVNGDHWKLKRVANRPHCFYLYGHVPTEEDFFTVMRQNIENLEIAFGQ